MNELKLRAEVWALAFEGAHEKGLNEKELAELEELALEDGVVMVPERIKNQLSLISIILDKDSDETLAWLFKTYGSKNENFTEHIRKLLRENETLNGGK